MNYLSKYKSFRGFWGQKSNELIRQIKGTCIMWKITSIFIALLSTTTLYAHGISGADKQSMLDGGYIRYIWLGASHMLTGYDHLLFLFGVMFFLTRFKDIVKFITAFTIGHCITLIFATFMGITANYFLVDAVIALTVIYKGFDNIDGFKKYLGIKAPNLLVLVFIFGLIHGFGLSTRLQQLPLGEDGLLLRIISFNVGVEIGQIIALSAMLLVLVPWRKAKSFTRLSFAANFSLMIVGAMLFLMQMHGFMHETFVDELAFSKEAHGHAHVKMLMDSKVKSGGPIEPYVIVENNTGNRIVNGDEPDKPEWREVITIYIPAKSDTEYKFYLIKGANMHYSWDADQGELFYDFHGEPTGGKNGYFESFRKGTSDKVEDSFTSPFDGTIGWYWHNKTQNPVKITLRAEGSFIVMGNKNKQELIKAIQQEKNLQEIVPEEEHGHAH